VLVAECFAFAFDAKDKLLVVDIDGTITKSDVQGLLMTFRYCKHTHLLMDCSTKYSPVLT
jgi:phosphatidate phosphatase PAH1